MTAPARHQWTPHSDALASAGMRLGAGHAAPPDPVPVREGMTCISGAVWWADRRAPSMSRREHSLGKLSVHGMPAGGGVFSGFTA